MQFFYTITLDELPKNSNNDLINDVKKKTIYFPDLL